MISDRLGVDTIYWFLATIFCSRSTASTEGDLRRLARLCKGKDSRERKARERSSKVKQGKTRCWAQRLLDRKRFCFWTCPRFRANHQTREACTWAAVGIFRSPRTLKWFEDQIGWIMRWAFAFWMLRRFEHPRHKRNSCCLEHKKGRDGKIATSRSASKRGFTLPWFTSWSI